MRYSEILILSVIGVVGALVIQTVVSLVGNDLLSYAVTDFLYTSMGAALIGSVLLAALIEESVRTMLLVYYAQVKGTPRNFWLYGATFGFGFGITEVMLAYSQASTFWHYLGLLGIIVIHVILSVFATYLIQYFTRFRIALTIFFLVIFHSAYNLIILLILPLLFS